MNSLEAQTAGLPAPGSLGLFPGQGPVTEDSNELSGCLRLRGLPFSVQEADVRAFFRSFAVQEVFLCKRNGRCTGEAFVQLSDPAVTQEALETLNRQHIGARYIELFQATAGDMLAAKASTADRLRGYVIRMRGLPYTASAADVLRLLDGIEVVRGMEGVIFTWTSDGRPTGEAFVELKDEPSQAEAMKRHKMLMGTRYIELFISTKAALVQAIQHNRFILGYANRRRWLQQAGVPQQIILPQQHSLQPILSQPMMARIDDVTDGLAGMSIQNQGLGRTVTRVIGQGQPGGGLYVSSGATGFGQVPANALQGGGTVRTAMPLMQADLAAQTGQSALGTYLQGQTIAAHGGHPSLGLQQVQVIQTQGYRVNSGVMQQPYIIQQGPSQYVTVGSPSGFGTAVQTMGGPGSDGGLNRGPYGGAAMQGQPIRAVQLPPGSNVQDYIQLSSATQDMGQGAGGSAAVTPSYMAGMGGLPSHMQSADGTTHVLHP